MIRDPSSMPSSRRESGVLSFYAKVALSLFVIWHVLALICEPMRMFSQTPVRAMGSDVALLKGIVGPYMEAMYLEHGYFFFAPNPGPTHLLQCEVRPRASQPDANSPATATLLLPDRKTHWPRLDYHRHFMLSEFYNALFAPSEPPPGIAPQSPMYRQWQDDLSMYRTLQNSVEQRMAYLYPDQVITLKRLERDLPNEYRVFEEKWRIDDPRLLQPLNDSMLAPTKTP